jgi:hypothetical protein
MLLNSYSTVVSTEMLLALVRPGREGKDGLAASISHHFADEGKLGLIDKVKDVMVRTSTVQMSFLWQDCTQVWGTSCLKAFRYC